MKWVESLHYWKKTRLQISTCLWFLLHKNLRVLTQFLRWLLGRVSLGCYRINKLLEIIFSTLIFCNLILSFCLQNSIFMINKIWKPAMSLSCTGSCVWNCSIGKIHGIFEFQTQHPVCKYAYRMFQISFFMNFYNETTCISFQIQIRNPVTQPSGPLTQAKIVSECPASAFWDGRNCN